AFPALLRPAEPDDAAATDLVLSAGVSVPVGSLVRLRRTDLPSAGLFRWVTALDNRRTDAGASIAVAVLDEPIPVAGDPQAVGDAAVVTATLSVDDADQSFERAEVLAGLGLHPAHPRYVGAVLAAESLLVRPAEAWSQALLPPSALLDPITAV